MTRRLGVVTCRAAGLVAGLVAVLVAVPVAGLVMCQAAGLVAGLAPLLAVGLMAVGPAARGTNGPPAKVWPPVGMPFGA